MRSNHKAQGFTVIELIIMISVVLIVSAGALLQIAPAMKNAKAETGLQTTLGQLRNARDLAIGQRKQYRLSFAAPRTMQLDRVVVDLVTKNRTFVFVSKIDLPKETQFIAVSGIPSASGTTPDSLPTTGPAIDFALDHGGAGTEVFFQPDGRALDSLGNLNNGVLYVARPGELLSSRAVSVLGASGRIKGWRLIQSSTKVVWTE